MKKIKLILSTFLIGLIILNSACKKDTESEPAKEQCEISNTGTIKVVNKTSYAITAKIDGGTPSTMGYILPGAEASMDVTAGVTHSLNVETVSGSSTHLTWPYTASVGACLTSIYNIIQ